MNTRMMPLDFEKDVPRDGKLFAAVQSYCEKEFGSRIDPRFYTRLWAVEALKDEDPEYSEVIGIVGIRNTIDCPTFHLSLLTPDKEGLRLAEQARDMMMYRVAAYIQDLGLRGSNVLVYVAPERERFWRRFLTRIKAVPANRYSITIG
jgi:hypothetical protein